MEDWIRLFNAEKQEDLDMIRTKNAGIMEAIGEMKRMGLVRRLRWRYEEWEKAKRDRWAEDEFVRDQGRAEGLAIGKAEDILLILAAKGEVTENLQEDLRHRIQEETDPKVLNKWVRLAATAKDVEEFQEKM